jgi:PAS domain S-box-containing protein
MPPPSLGAWQGAHAVEEPVPPPTGRRTRDAPGSWARHAADGTSGGRVPPPRGSAAGGRADGTTAEDGVLAALDAVETLSVLTFDTGLHVVRVAGAMLHGADGAALVGHHPRELVDVGAWARLAPGYEGALAGRTSVLDTPSLDGTRWYRATFRPLLAERRIVGGTATFVDVTAERRDERRLDELREVLAASFDRSPVGQALLSPEGELMRVNEALRRLVDRPDERLVGANVRDLTDPGDREREDALLRSVRGGERDGYDVEKRVVRGDGVTIAVHARVTAIRTREATLRGFIAHVDDLAHWDAGRAY